MTRHAGVYTILNLVTGRRYIGSSFNVAKRWQQHLSALGRGEHDNVALQADWQKYGCAAFSWTMEQCLSRSDAIALEQRRIDEHHALYNAARRAGSGPADGFKHTPESIAHMRAAQALNMGKRVKRSEESRRKMSAFQKGRPKSPAHRAKIGAANRKPCPASSLAQRGKTFSQETKEKMAAAKRGTSWTVDRWHAYALRYAT
jgi:group I intron endonuclease